MIRYYPLDAGVSFDCEYSDLVSFNWQEMVAEFSLPGDDTRSLRIYFGRFAIVRMLDEMPLSTESDPATWVGLVPSHFAYRVEGATFVEQQSPAWRQVFGPVKHFQFMTGNGCLDVLSPSEPAFSIVSVAG